MAAPSRFRIRKAQARDIESITSIEDQQFQHPWKKKFFTDELTHDICYFYVAEDTFSRQVAGYIIFWLISEEIELHNLAVAKDYKKKGIGKQLMLFMLDCAETHKVQEIFLEVRESNKEAIAFYEAFQFKRVNVRKDYYSNPIEDAVVYRLVTGDG
jgi:ribosomal-protein-alanine N-acetyltransferase